MNAEVEALLRAGIDLWNRKRSVREHEPKSRMLVAAIGDAIGQDGLELELRRRGSEQVLGKYTLRLEDDRLVLLTPRESPGPEGADVLPPSPREEPPSREPDELRERYSVPEGEPSHWFG